MPIHRVSSLALLVTDRNVNHKPNPQSVPTKLRTALNYHWPAVAITVTFVILAGIYSIATPPLEAGDESRHYAVVKYMADTGRLPVQQPGPAQVHWSHEGNQPPLYYALAALATGWIDTGTWEDVYWYNPHTTIGNPLRPDNKNITIHPPVPIEQRNSRLAVYISRWLSIIMGTVTVVTSYLIALALFRNQRWPATGAMSITAFNPMFIFISAAVNNDNAVIMFVTLTLLLLVQPNQQIRRPLFFAALVGGLIGLGALSKLYAFGLLPLALLRLLWLAWGGAINSKRALWQNTLLWGVTLLVVFMAVAGWFYIRNAILYNGDFFALDVMRETAGQREEFPTLATISSEFEGFRIAYWALFGGVNILADPWIYKALDIVSLLAFIGLLAFLVMWLYTIVSRKSVTQLRGSPAGQVEPVVFMVLLGWSSIMFAGFIVWNITQPAGQGRLMYPAIAAISPLGMLGLIWWLPKKIKAVVATVCALGLFLFAAIAPFRYIAPSYAAPPLLAVTDLPRDIQPVNFIYDDTVRLLGYQLHTQTVRPAETVPITLYWELIAPAPLDYSVFVHLLGRQRQVIGQIDTYPGEGKWPTTLLKPGDIVAGSYQVPILPEAEFSHAPVLARIAVGIYDFYEPGRPGKLAVNQAGEPVDPVITAVRLIPWQWPDISEDKESINFADKITLTDYQLDASHPQQPQVTFRWRADASPHTDYTVFIQAWDSTNNEYIAGFDGPPVNGDYPTSVWSAGDIISDTHILDITSLPPGSYDLLIGLYDPVTGERLVATAESGPLRDFALHIGEITVLESSAK
jgi:hypothetical protein